MEFGRDPHWQCPQRLHRIENSALALAPIAERRSLAPVFPCCHFQALEPEGIPRIKCSGQEKHSRVALMQSGMVRPILRNDDARVFWCEDDLVEFRRSFAEDVRTKLKANTHRP